MAPTLVKRCDERVDPWFYRFGKAFWLGSLEQMPDDPKVFDSARMVEFVKGYVQEQAAIGNCVVVGRGAACMLARSPGAYHVFVYASMARKIRYIEEKFPEHAGDAENEIIATDRRRAEYIRRFHQREWDDRKLYHLMMNSCMGMHAMVEATVEAAGLHSVAAGCRARAAGGGLVRVAPALLRISTPVFGLRGDPHSGPTPSRQSDGCRGNQATHRATLPCGSTR